MRLPPAQIVLQTHSMLRFLAMTLLLGATVCAAEKKKLLLIGQGSDGHPPGTHEFMAGTRVVQALLSRHGDLSVSVVKADEPWADGPAQLDAADGAILLVTQGAEFMQKTPERFAAFQRMAQRRGALVALHWSIGAKDERFIDGQIKLLGGTRGGPQRKYKILETDVRRLATDHPVLAGVPDFRIKDEFYYRLELLPKSAPGFHPLLSAKIDDSDETVAWAWERPDGGRSFGYVGFHFHTTWERPEYRRLVANAILWAVGRDVPAVGAPADVPAEVLKL
jgi:type 1 glutamine amidotransferase